MLLITIIVLTIFVLSLPNYGTLISLILIIYGIFILISAIKTLELDLRERNPYKEISGLKTNGINSYTRNPMYFGLHVISLGIVLFFQNILVLAIACLSFTSILLQKMKKKNFKKSMGRNIRNIRRKYRFFIPFQLTRLFKFKKKMISIKNDFYNNPK